MASNEQHLNWDNPATGILESSNHIATGRGVGAGNFGTLNKLPLHTDTAAWDEVNNKLNKLIAWMHANKGRN